MIDAWLWVLVGVLLLLGELLTPGGFFIIFFGIAAVLVGVLVGLGLGGPDWWQWLLFSLLSVGSLLFFRHRLLARFASPDQPLSKGDVVGEEAILLEDLPPGELGKAELRGTIWNARNAGTENLHKGQRYEVQRVNGLTLWIGGK